MARGNQKVLEEEVSCGAVRCGAVGCSVHYPGTLIKALQAAAGAGAFTGAGTYLLVDGSYMIVRVQVHPPPITFCYFIFLYFTLGD